MSFRVERRFNLLILEEGEEYVADVSATMVLVRRGREAESKGRLRIGSKSLVFQPDEVSASILKFPYRHVRSIGGVEGVVGSLSFPVECDQFVNVATKTGTETRIVTPFSISKARICVNFRVHYANVDEYLQIIQRLWEASARSACETEQVARDILTQVTSSVQFDMSRLGHRERALLAGHAWVRRVKPLLEVRGMLQISDEAIYFQPHPNFESKPAKRLPHEDVLHIFRRIYGVQANALEIITVHGSCLYLCFEAQTDCERVEQILLEQRRELSTPAGIAEHSQTDSLGEAEDVLQDIHRMTALWQRGLLSNFHYLDFLNCAAGRSQNDFSQYPVFPWVLRDYAGEVLDLGSPEVYRDLTKPIGALNEKRLTYFRERMEGMSAEERFLYGTHYSTPAYVIYWLLRAMPERMLRLHNGNFDHGPRLFRSVLDSWESVNESTASLMELIPEFFVLPAGWLENGLGITTADGPLTDVQLPRWAANVTDFICKMRAALESEWVSRQLPAWIDLIFGYKQKGEDAAKADNLFHPVCYTVSRDGEPTDDSGLPISVLETQLQEFGRMPQQLFVESHPPRLRIPKWEPQRLESEPLQSEPWYKVVRQISAGSVVEDATVVPASAPPASPSSLEISEDARPPSVAAVGLQGPEPSSKTEAATTAAMMALLPHAVGSLSTTGRVTGAASCDSNMYFISEDGCLRVSPLSLWNVSRGQREEPASVGLGASLRRNFRISPMPLSALAVLRTDLLAIGGHDNAVTLYSSSSGSAVAKCQAHADTVTCLGVSPGGGTLVSGSRDQSVMTWAFTAASLKSDITFDDLLEPITCAVAGRNLVLAGAMDGQLMAWDKRSGQSAGFDKELGGEVVSCLLDADERLAAALDGSGELRLWDLRHRCESLRLSVLPRTGSSMMAANCFMTDFAGWALLGGKSADGCPAVSLWGLSEQRELCSWQVEEDSRGGSMGVQFLVWPPSPTSDGGYPGAGATRGGCANYRFLSATSTGNVHAFSRRWAS